MGYGHGRASSGWLALREPADAAARASELVQEVRRHLPRGKVAVIHDLGCGTGSMSRWLAAQLPGPQHWVLVDRDAELLSVVSTRAPQRAADGARVTVETRHRDISHLVPHELRGAALITASALLDMMNGAELDRFVEVCAGAGCPVLVTLSVTGRVDLEPPDPFDQLVGAAFNAHQRRRVDGHRLLGPGAVVRAVDSFRSLGLEVLARPSPWRLGPEQGELAAQWFAGWLGAASEQDPSLAAAAVPYSCRRRAQAAVGRLEVTVHHQDLLVLP